MPSTPILSPPLRKASPITDHFAFEGKRHQTVYEDTRGRYIVESRRHSRMASHVDAVNLDLHRRASAISYDATKSGRCASSIDSPSDPASAASSTSSAKPSRGRISAKRSAKRPKAKVVLVTALEAHMFESQSRDMSSQWVEPTPPPTPRLGRLSTPELSDLDEASFCECDIKSAQVIYCKLCKKQAGPHSRRT